MFSLFKVLRSERLILDSQIASMPDVLNSRIREGGDRSSWRQRLTRRMTYASEQQITRYVDTVAAPAIEEVAAELEKLGADVHCHRGEHTDHPIPYIDLTVCFPEQEDFKYQAYPVAYSVPNFAANIAVTSDVYYQLEVFSATGSRGQDLMGYTKDQVIADVLDAYDAHVAFMTLTGDQGAPAARMQSEVPEQWDDTDQAVVEDAAGTPAAPAEGESR